MVYSIKFPQTICLIMDVINVRELSKKERMTQTIDEFIEKAKEVHRDKYDYSLVDYKNNSTKVKIICSEHGVFNQTPNSHISGSNGCSKCSGKFKITANILKHKAKIIHGSKYDYSLVSEIKNSTTKIKIVCPEHGMFFTNSKRTFKPKTRLSTLS